MSGKALLTVREAAEAAGIPVRAMRRQLRAMHEQSHGRLLISRSGTRHVRKWWIAAGVLDQLLELKRLERAGWKVHEELDALGKDARVTNDRIDVLDARTTEQTRLLREQGARLQKTESQLLSHSKVLKSLQKATSALLEVSQALAGETPGP